MDVIVIKFELGPHESPVVTTDDWDVAQHVAKKFGETYGFIPSSKAVFSYSDDPNPTVMSFTGEFKKGGSAVLALIRTELLGVGIEDYYYTEGDELDQWEFYEENLRYYVKERP